MENLSKYVLVLALLMAWAVNVSCLEEKDLCLSVFGDVCAVFEEDERSANFTDPAIIDFAMEIDALLEENGFTRDDIKEATVNAAAVETIVWPGGHDWIVTGQITVQRIDGTPGPVAVLIEYTTQSVVATLNNRTPVALTAAGVDLLNQAALDFIDGQDPVLEFIVTNGTVDPVPSDADPMIFTWKAFLIMNILLSETVELPDPL